MSDWVDTVDVPKQRYMVMDAMGEIIEGVLRARKTEDGVEVYAQATTQEGQELVCTHDDGQTFEGVEAYMRIPGGMLEDISEEEP